MQNRLVWTILLACVSIGLRALAQGNDELTPPKMRQKAGEAHVIVKPRASPAAPHPSVRGLVGSLPERIELDEHGERLFGQMEIADPALRRVARVLLKPGDRVDSEEAWEAVWLLMRNGGSEGRRAVADALGCRSHVTRIMILRSLTDAGADTEYFLRKILEHWDGLLAKEKKTLRRSLPAVVRRYGGDQDIRAVAEELAARMIGDDGRIVPLAGIELAVEQGWQGESVQNALRHQTANEIFDWFENEHPVRKAALEALGETYTPPPREEVDFASISIVERTGLQPADSLTVGVLASLYTARGPCIGGGEYYGWRGPKRAIKWLSELGIRTLVYAHPITEADTFPLESDMKEAHITDPMLNAASVRDLAMCDVVFLDRAVNLRAEVVDALESFVWDGRGIVSIEGAGIVTCQKEDKLAALQDMHRIDWAWRRADEEYAVQNVDTALTRGLDWSLPLARGTRGFISNGYTLGAPQYDDQILLRFKGDENPALRIARYGRGRIAHFGWLMQQEDSAAGRRENELMARVLRWAAGREYQHINPGSAFSKERYVDKQD